jgi:ABC-type multidrug transport system ATPase subunit
VAEKDHTILISSHITGDIEKLADEVVFIDGGKIVLKGNKKEILKKQYPGLENPSLEDIMLFYVNQAG